MVLAWQLSFWCDKVWTRKPLLLYYSWFDTSCHPYPISSFHFQSHGLSKNVWPLRKMKIKSPLFSYLVILFVPLWMACWRYLWWVWGWYLARCPKKIAHFLLPQVSPRNHEEERAGTMDLLSDRKVVITCSISFPFKFMNLSRTGQSRCFTHSYVFHCLCTVLGGPLSFEQIS